MSVFKGSRYENCVYIGITGTDLVTRKYVFGRVALTQADIAPSWIQHEIKDGDALDSLAYQYAGDDADKTKYWWKIADVNEILWPLDIEAGTRLIVPVKEIREGTA
jgi:hypothetical protein